MERKRKFWEGKYGGEKESIEIKVKKRRKVLKGTQRSKFGRGHWFRLR